MKPTTRKIFSFICWNWTCIEISMAKRNLAENQGTESSDDGIRHTLMSGKVCSNAEHIHFIPTTALYVPFMQVKI
jgi:hypothetical protein